MSAKRTCYNERRARIVLLHERSGKYMKKALVVVDMQVDFITGALGNEQCRAIVPNVAAKVKSAQESGTDLIFTMDTHGEDYLDTQEGKNLPVPHCIRGTEGWQIIPELKDAADQSGKKVEKDTFGSMELGRYLSEAGYEEAELVGVCTDICVISNGLILKAAFPETVIRVAADCCAGVTPESHEHALEAMKSCQIHVVNEGKEPY